ncbi:hypothetical protein GCM10009753_52800 [Streptantibioticus ferralitis]
MRHVARRPVPEIAKRGAAREVSLGGGIGLGFVLLSALVITVFGGARSPGPGMASCPWWRPGW